VICYRHATYRTPLRPALMPDTLGARYHRGSEPEPTQYLCLHPLGPHAEVLRGHGLREPAQARALRLRTWALDVATDGLVDVAFEDALVADDVEACRALADRLRARGAPGAIVPSAALPGTRNIVLFGPRVAAPYGIRVLGPVDVKATITGENGQALVALLDLVRFRGDAHPGAGFVFEEPSWELAA